MKTVNTYKAHRLTQHSPELESLTINVCEELPDLAYENMDSWRAIAMHEAAKIEEALASTLPQGVFDALLVRMLDRKRSLFVIPGEPTTITYERTPE